MRKGILTARGYFQREPRLWHVLKRAAIDTAMYQDAFVTLASACVRFFQIIVTGIGQCRTPVDGTLPSEKARMSDFSSRSRLTRVDRFSR